MSLAVVCNCTFACYRRNLTFWWTFYLESSFWRWSLCCLLHRSSLSLNCRWCYSPSSARCSDCWMTSSTSWSWSLIESDCAEAAALRGNPSEWTMIWPPISSSWGCRNEKSRPLWTTRYFYALGQKTCCRLTRTRKGGSHVWTALSWWHWFLLALYSFSFQFGIFWVLFLTSFGTSSETVWGSLKAIRKFLGGFPASRRWCRELHRPLLVVLWLTCLILIWYFVNLVIIVISTPLAKCWILEFLFSFVCLIFSLSSFVLFLSCFYLALVFLSSLKLHSLASNRISLRQT